MSLHPLRLMVALFIVPGIGLAAAPPAPSPAEQELEEATKLTGDAQRGARLFAPCVTCHGGGRGNADGTVPAIAGQHRRVTVKQLVDSRHLLRLDPRTERSAAIHALPSAQAIADVAAHVASLDRRGAAAGRGDGRQVALGRTTYAATCASCHGASGEGNANEGVPRVAGQHYASLVRQLEDSARGWRPRYTPDHMPLLNTLSPDQLTGLADALSRM